MGADGPARPMPIPMTLGALLAQYAPLLLQGAAKGAGQAGAQYALSKWKRWTRVRRAAKKAGRLSRRRPGLRGVKKQLVAWADSGPYTAALQAWTSGQTSDPAAFVDQFVRTTGFSTGAGPDRTREEATRVLRLFLGALLDDTVVGEGGSPTQTRYLDGRRASSDAQTQAAIERLVEAVDGGPRLDAAWFRTQATRAIRAADRRYTPDVHVPLPVEQAFGGLAHTPEFYQAVRSLAADVATKAEAADQTTAAVATPDATPHEFRLTADQLSALLTSALPETRFPSKEAGVLANKLFHDAEEASSIYYRQGRHQREGQGDERQRSNDYLLQGARERCLDLHRSALDVVAAMNRGEGRSAEAGALLLTGAAGTGKSHLLCRVADERTQAGLPTVLVLGQSLGRGEPWAQILDGLGLDTTRDRFLDALESAGKAVGQRSLLLIDALNESETRSQWLTHLPQIVQDVQDRPHLALAVSVRSDYLDLVVPPSLRESDTLARVDHRGFAGHEREATDRYFSAYGITPPAAPILTPEYSNPLFLKLLCEGLQRRGLDAIPEGFDGQSALVDFFVGALDASEALPAALDLDAASQPVRSASSRLAARMAATASLRLPRHQAVALANEATPGRPWSQSLYPHLLSEGLLREDPDFSASPPADTTTFAYERLGDHLVAHHLVRDFHSPDDLRAALAPGGPLHPFVADHAASVHHVGLLTALAILIPEQFGVELPDVAPDPALEGVDDALVLGLLWRRGDTVTDHTRDQVRDALRRDPRLDEILVETRLTLALRPDHPLNADALHASLSALPMAQRDAGWAVAVAGDLDRDDASLAWRLVEWAEGGGEGAGPETVRLAGLTLAWFLVSPHRPLRDRTTKALVALYQGRLDALPALLDAFADVDAPYVVERLYAVAYGCAMRNRATDPGGVGRLAQAVYDLAFADAPPVHVLARDYARGVVECALDIGQALDGDPDRARPPYKSDPLGPLPTEADVDAILDALEPRDQTDQAALSALKSSARGFGDFSRYVVGETGSSFDWRSRTLGDPTPTLDDELDAFFAALSPEQAAAYHTWREHHDNPPPRLPPAERSKNKDNEDGTFTFSVPLWTLPEGYEEERDRLANAFEALLPPDQADDFRGRLRPHIETPERDPYPFDLIGLKNWVLLRVLDLGWTPQRFGPPDAGHARRHWQRDATAKPERFGKKYQWLAYHEAVARIADHHEYTDPYENEPNRVVPYDGPWRHFLRDIDPSCLLPHTTAKADEGAPFWPPPADGLWGDGLADAAWLRQDHDLPDLPRFLAVQDPDGQDLLALRFTMTWTDPGSSREVWAHVTSALVPVGHLDQAAEFGHRWRGSPNNVAGWLPWPHDPDHVVFLGEWHWAPAYHALRFTPEVPGPGEVSDRGSHHHVPFPFEPTSESYKGSSQYDASLDERGVHLLLPSPGLARRLGLRWDGRAAWLDADGRRVVYDPTPYVGPAEDSRSVLLITRDAAEALNRDHGLALVWSVAGEKQRLEMSGGPVGHQRFFGSYLLRDRQPVGQLYAQFHPHE